MRFRRVMASNGGAGGGGESEVVDGHEGAPAPKSVPPPRAPGYHGDDRWLLLWAALIGVIGALATGAFYEGMVVPEHLATGHPGSLVSAAKDLAPWRRAITPALG